MAQPVVHFEVVGKNPEQLRRYYGQLFGWEFDTGGAVSPQVSEAGDYGFVENKAGIPGGIGGGADYAVYVTFYVGVPDVEAALQKAESLGGTRRMGPDQVGNGLIVGHFSDPEGHLIGVAATP